MSGAEESRRPLGERLLEAVVVLGLLALLLVGRRWLPAFGAGAGTIAAVGILLMGGTVLANLLELVGLPHLTGYLLAGVATGPYVLGMVDHHAVEDLAPVNQLALSLIALAGGAELRLASLKSGLRTLAWATLWQNLLVMVVLAVVFFAARPLLPFLAGVPTAGVVGVGLLWGVIAVTRSPSATLGILSQTRAKGPLATATLNFVMASDVVVVVLLALVMTIARPLIAPGSTLSLAAFRELGVELLGSISVGTTLGLLLAVYLRLGRGKGLVLLLIALGLVFTELFDYLHFDWLLIFMTAGFVVQNLSKQGPLFVSSIESMGEVVYVVFFGVAGAHLDLPVLRGLWPVALLFVVSRGATSWVAGRVASRFAEDPPALRTWGWAGLVSQAGLALGISANVQSEFPAFGAGLGALAIATVAMNEMVGPVLFKVGLDRCGETQGAEEDVEPAGAVEAFEP
ncbi:MAG: cation:proton antiporter [Myxococcaceae bacterium]